jgi:hypothetical protein
MNRGQRGDDTSDLVGRSGVFRVARGSPESGLDIGGFDVESGQHPGDDAGFCLAEGDQQVAISDPPLASEPGGAPAGPLLAMRDIEPALGGTMDPPRDILRRWTLSGAERPCTWSAVTKSGDFC